MGTKLYVGNLSFNTTETDLQDLFAQAGAVQDVMLMQINSQASLVASLL